MTPKSILSQFRVCFESVSGLRSFLCSVQGSSRGLAFDVVSGQSSRTSAQTARWLESSPDWLEWGQGMLKETQTSPLPATEAPLVLTHMCTREMKHASVNLPSLLLLHLFFSIPSHTHHDKLFHVCCISACVRLLHIASLSDKIEVNITQMTSCRSF